MASVHDYMLLLLLLVRCGGICLSVAAVGTDGPFHLVSVSSVGERRVATPDTSQGRSDPACFFATVDSSLWSFVRYNSDAILKVLCDVPLSLRRKKTVRWERRCDFSYAFLKTQPTGCR